MSKHTTAPWEITDVNQSNGQVDGRLVFTIQGKHIDGYMDWTVASVWKDCGSNGEETAEANANLIAAAPDMYEALKIARRDLINLANAGVDRLTEIAPFQEWDSGESVSATQVARIDEALAKAEGKQ